MEIWQLRGLKAERESRAKKLERLILSDSRRNVVSNSTELDFHRFLLSSNPAERKKLKDYKSAVQKLMKKHPEVAGSTIFGSQVQGFARGIRENIFFGQGSDLDAYILIDKDKLPETTISDPLEELDRDIKASVKASGFEVVLRQVMIRNISSRWVLESCTTGNFKDNEMTGDIGIMHLFHIGIGRGIYQYRNLTITALEILRPRGEKLWAQLMGQLSEFENGQFDDELQNKRKTLYPKTLAEGRKYFLSHSPKDISAS